MFSLRSVSAQHIVNVFNQLPYGEVTWNPVIDGVEILEATEDAFMAGKVNLVDTVLLGNYYVYLRTGYLKTHVYTNIYIYIYIYIYIIYIYKLQVLIRMKARYFFKYNPQLMLLVSSRIF